VTFHSDAAIEGIEHFVMTDPPRLVVDLYGVKGGSPRPATALTGGFRQLRSGAHVDKTRFVFDAAGTVLPSFDIDQAERRVTINWRDPSTQTGAKPRPASSDGLARVALIEIVDARDEASSALIHTDTLAPIAKVWRHQVRIQVRPFSGLKALKHALLRGPDRLVIELVGVEPVPQRRSFRLHNGFSRLVVDGTQQSLLLSFEMGDGDLSGFDIIEAPSAERVIVAWGALGNDVKQSAPGAAQ
jgi:hypothetical protein